MVGLPEQYRSIGKEMNTERRGWTTNCCMHKTRQVFDIIFHWFPRANVFRISGLATGVESSFQSRLGELIVVLGALGSMLSPWALQDLLFSAKMRVRGTYWGGSISFKYTQRRLRYSKRISDALLSPYMALLLDSFALALCSSEKMRLACW